MSKEQRPKKIHEILNTHFRGKVSVQALRFLFPKFQSEISQHPIHKDNLLFLGILELLLLTTSGSIELRSLTDEEFENFTSFISLNFTAAIFRYVSDILAYAERSDLTEGQLRRLHAALQKGRSLDTSDFTQMMAAATKAERWADPHIQQQGIDPFREQSLKGQIHHQGRHLVEDDPNSY
jgi:hypothetical protein